MQLLFRNTNLLSIVLLKLQSLFYDLFVALVSVSIERANCCLFVCLLLRFHHGDGGSELPRGDVQGRRQQQQQSVAGS
jgi:hypothetical protein